MNHIPTRTERAKLLTPEERASNINLPWGDDHADRRGINHNIANEIIDDRCALAEAVLAVAGYFDTPADRPPIEAGRAMLKRLRDFFTSEGLIGKQGGGDA